MTYETLVLNVADHIATIELNRPDKLNSIDKVMLDELPEVFAETNADPDVRVVVVTGRGKTYCVGADLSGGSKTFDSDEAGWGDEIDEFRDGGGLITLKIFESTKPVIGAVNGVAAGLGATMLLPMDFILAAESARFGFVFAKRGIVPEACSTWFLPKKVGISKAAEWFYTGRMVSSAEALESGLVRSVHTDEDLLPAAYALAREIADNASPVAVGMIRQMLWRFVGSDHPMDAHRIDSRINYELGTTPDVVEGITSFLEKRPPQFPGQLPGNEPTSYPWWEEPSFTQG
ncbi:crotonase/enoyl-CoA hydratase family protein [Aeromicrobium panaciterrae]|uniref:enoyl-CoA hydratase-related protein n=1 Tax=Aeromicrobium panaciterrae TaxID=363861 RepID=UPI0031CF003A